MWFLVLVQLAALLQAFEFDHAVRVRPAEYQAVPLEVRTHPAWINLQFRVFGTDPPVRVALLPAADERRLRAGRTVEEVAATTYERQGQLRAYIAVPGDYVLVVDNRPNAQQGARVRLRGTVEYDMRIRGARQLPVARQVAVIAISLSIFFGVVWIAGGRLWAATVTRRRHEPPPPSS